MWTEDLSDLTAEDIQQLVEDGAEESATREYKQQLFGGNDEDKREFLYDVAAFANGPGGFLIFGIAERRDTQNQPTGIAGDIVGIASQNLSGEVSRL